MIIPKLKLSYSKFAWFYPVPTPNTGTYLKFGNDGVFSYLFQFTIHYYSEAILSASSNKFKINKQEKKKRAKEIEDEDGVWG